MTDNDNSQSTGSSPGDSGGTGESGSSGNSGGSTPPPPDTTTHNPNTIYVRNTGNTDLKTRSGNNG